MRAAWLSRPTFPPRCAALYPDQMKYKDLRDFVGRLETLGELRRIPQNVSPILEMTEQIGRAHV